MRHRRYTVKLGRNSSHRRAMFSNLCVSIIGCFGLGCCGVVSTIPKLKAVRPMVERLVALSVRAYQCDLSVLSGVASGESLARLKAESVSSRRRLYRVLRRRGLVERAVSIVGKAYVARDGGYVRVLRLHDRRIGDGGNTGLLQWVVEGDVVTKR